MKLLDELLNKNHSNKKAEGNKITSETRDSMRIYCALLMDSFTKINEFNELLEAPHVDHDPSFTSKLTMPIEILGFNALIIIFSNYDNQPICAWLESTENE